MKKLRVVLHTNDKQFEKYLTNPTLHAESGAQNVRQLPIKENTNVTQLTYIQI